MCTINHVERNINEKFFYKPFFKPQAGLIISWYSKNRKEIEKFQGLMMLRCKGWIPPGSNIQTITNPLTIMSFYLSVITEAY